ncbi:hypothetical protein ABZ345_15330 [Lentzea sp. NPDC005914]|uniref:hypothetical protein n=1 Tax=Lentzea sp. NPDC005914 TaxID=3154572 RepID=UPI0033C40EBE
MQNSIKLALVAAAAVAAMTACTSTPVPKHDAMPRPTSTTSTSETPTPPSVVTEVVTLTVTNPPAPEPEPVIEVEADNRIGYGAAKLGMTLDEARAAGLTTKTWENAGEGEDVCVADDKLAISKKHGIIRITLPKDAQTSKGIGLGATFADVKRAYPDATEYRGGFNASIDSAAFYSFGGSPGSDASKVESLKIEARVADCALALI